MSGFVKMPRELMLCKWLTPTDKLVYMMIADKYDFAKKVNYLKDEKKIGLSIRKLSEQSGIDRRAIRKSIDKLCSYDFIREYKEKGEKSYYTAAVKLDDIEEILLLMKQSTEEAKKNIA